MAENLKQGQPNTAVLGALAGQAVAGQLKLDPQIAKDAAVACDHLTDELQTVLLTVNQLDVSLPLGGFHCGGELATVLRDVAVGGDGLRTRIFEHIDAVQQIKSMVTGQVANLQASDSHTSNAVKTVGSQVGR